MRVYVDLVVLLNFMVDLLLLLGVNRLSGHPVGFRRAVLSAVLGGIYSGVCLLPGFRFLGNTLWRLVFLGLMGIVAFGLCKSAWKRTGLFVLLSMALGGVALMMGRADLWGVVLPAVGVFLLCRIGFGGSVVGREYLPLEIRHRGLSVRLTALIDTGHSLRDPVTGEQVLIISPDAAAKLTGLQPEQLRNPLETITRRAVPGLRLIPYHAVGQPAGMLLGMRFQDVTVGGRRAAAIVAFAPDRIGRGDMYQALAGGAV